MEATRLSLSEDRYVLRLHGAGRSSAMDVCPAQVYYMQSDRQQQFAWSQEVSPVWKQGLFPSAIWIDLIRSIFFILPDWIPTFFATSLTSFMFITALQ